MMRIITALAAGERDGRVAVCCMCAAPGLGFDEPIGMLRMSFLSYGEAIRRLTQFVREKMYILIYILYTLQYLDKEFDTPNNS